MLTIETLPTEIELGSISLYFNVSGNQYCVFIYGESLTILIELNPNHYGPATTDQRRLVVDYLLRET